MIKLYCAGLELHTDYLVLTKDKKIVFANLLSRSASTVQSFIANIYKQAKVQYDRETLYASGDYIGFLDSYSVGKTKYTQGIIKSEQLFNKKVSTNENTVDTFFIVEDSDQFKSTIYEVLYQLTDLPIISEWIDYIVKRLEAKRFLNECRILMTDDYSHIVNGPNGKSDMKNWKFYSLKASIKDLDAIIENGLKAKEISICDETMNPITASSIDAYYQTYGVSIVENVLRNIKPLMQRVQELPFKTHTKMAMPQQAEIVNGVVNYLKDKNYVIINGGMGVGKTFISILISTMMKEHHRSIIMAPGHMLEKWKEEILTELPNANVVILDSFEKVVKLRDQVGNKPVGANYYIISKDFSKLGSEMIPSPHSVGKKQIPMVKCADCERLSYDTGQEVCECGSKNITRRKSVYKMKGLLCPKCGELIYSSKPHFESAYYFDDEKDSRPLQYSDFRSPTNKNAVCGHCDEALWQLSVKNLKSENEYAGMQSKSRKWIKLTLPRNKSNLTFKTEYYFKTEYDELVEDGTLNNENHRISNISELRKYPPALFMKKFLGKGFFDFGFFDEVHELKGAASSQALAAHHLQSCSKKKVLLTGTLTGGFATDLFYLLYRVDPQLMKREGFQFSDNMKFAEEFGVISTKRSYENETEYFNKSSKGRSIGSKSVLPGISPLLFTTLLINNTVFLELSDFDAFLTELREIPIGVEMSPKTKDIYSRVSSTLKGALKEKGTGAQKLLGQFLPTLLSLPDVNVLDNIIHPHSGDVLFRFKDNPEDYYDEDGFLPKEKELIETVQLELSENRNVFVYCEYTSEGAKNVTQRLKTLIEKNCGLEGQVDILKSTILPRKRMAWIKKRASEGVKVFITNPRLVKTGLDFIFKYEGKLYNYPTIIFFQVGYDLFTAWQASARHRRLIQMLECRTYYMYYKNTLQEVALETLANKRVATAALQGSFSEEGLNAMANSVDPKVQLANALQNGINSNDIDALFKSYNEKNKRSLTEAEVKCLERLSELWTKNDDVFEQFDFTQQIDLVAKMELITNTVSKVIGKKRVAEGQLMLF